MVENLWVFNARSDLRTTLFVYIVYIYFEIIKLIIYWGKR